MLPRIDQLKRRKQIQRLAVLLNNGRVSEKEFEGAVNLLCSKDIHNVEVARLAIDEFSKRKVLRYKRMTKPEFTEFVESLWKKWMTV